MSVEKQRTTVDLEKDIYVRLRAWLESHTMSLADWIDKQARRELGLPPKFGYKATTRGGEDAVESTE